MSNKRGIEFSFTWIFAVIIGAFILVLAIYATTKIISTGETQTATVTAKEIGILLNPLETGFEEETTTSFSVNTDTRIYNDCDNIGEFGNQIIKTSQKSFGKWANSGIEIEFQNKYIFSGNYEEGKIFHVFSKSFDFPFKVADVIFLSSSDKKYCFFNAPTNIKGELEKLKQANLLTDCTGDENAIKVCFDSATSTGCNVTVKYNSGYVEKKGERLYFETDALMYGAIFADKEVYECQTKRLMQRAENLGSIYNKKASLLEQKDCHSNIDFSSFLTALENYKDSSNLGILFSVVNSMKNSNEVASCRLW